MFGIRMTDLVKDVSTFECSIETLAIHAKAMMGSHLFAEPHQIQTRAELTRYNPQLDLAVAQAQLSRYNR